MHAHIHTQIEFLEVRLAEVMAYADIPPSMRPALSEYDPFVAIMGHSNRGGRCVFWEWFLCVSLVNCTIRVLRV